MEADSIEQEYISEPGRLDLNDLTYLNKISEIITLIYNQ